MRMVPVLNQLAVDPARLRPKCCPRKRPGCRSARRPTVRGRAVRPYLTLRARRVALAGGRGDGREPARERPPQPPRRHRALRRIRHPRRDRSPADPAGLGQRPGVVARAPAPGQPGPRWADPRPLPRGEPGRYPHLVDRRGARPRERAAGIGEPPQFEPLAADGHARLATRRADRTHRTASGAAAPARRRDHQSGFPAPHAAARDTGGISNMSRKI